MDIELTIRGKVAEAIQHNYGQEINKDLVLIQKTRKEFKGDLTIVVFPFLRFSKKTPEFSRFALRRGISLVITSVKAIGSK